jgi:hypothetical protein
VINGDVPVELAYPVLSSDSEINPMADWNKVFIPYCTGDTHLVMWFAPMDPQASDPTSSSTTKDTTTRSDHQDLNHKFKRSQDDGSGCSAVAWARSTTIRSLRRNEGVERGYLIADSGPVIPGTLLSGQPSHSKEVCTNACGDLGVSMPNDRLFRSAASAVG